MSAGSTLPDGATTRRRRGEHSGTQVRVAGMGPGAANIVGLTDQTDVFRTISRALSLR
ncbi:alkaline phosphatase [Saccharopolyspora shandongensis]|uniref:alkaline phosphatase n=1 Tax=Saccharopolyspora shandongensis TaxID=418495 RepID=UPI0033FA133C